MFYPPEKKNTQKKTLQTASHIKQTDIKQLQTGIISWPETKKKSKKVARLLDYADSASTSGVGSVRATWWGLAPSVLPMGLAGQSPGIHYMKCHLNMESISKMSSSQHQFLDVSFRKGV